MYTAASGATSQYPRDYRGLSTDTKPTTNVANGSTYLEMDTGDVYLWDAENEQWREI